MACEATLLVCIKCVDCVFFVGSIRVKICWPVPLTPSNVLKLLLAGLIATLVFRSISRVTSLALAHIC